ncbi:HAAS signaling domain-containing protein [Proteiniclasticum sp.]|uniref:HAAS signaling domain-containing protein n=1 Tax=Proteiniclasticum sp. TaxID=2053595 RepID=UPI002897858E|nr:hypothetical protein [Proteiniclasticum sp.]
MNHIDKYVYGVVKYLPEKEREEIAKELRANIEDMLEGDHSEENIVHVLEEMGSPYDLAVSYMGKDNYIIGPRVYHAYIEVMKVIMVVALVLGIIVFAIDLATQGEEINSLGNVISVIAGGFGTIFSVLLGFAFWVTLFFIIIERTDSIDEIRSSIDKPFKVSSLKDIPAVSRKKISKVEMIITLVFTIFSIYIFLFRNDLIAIYRSGQEPVRAFNADAVSRYMFIILLAGAFSIFVSTLKLIYGRWNELLGILSSVDALISLGVMALILLSGDIINPEFIDDLNQIIGDVGVNRLTSIDALISGLIAFVCVMTLIEIGTSLYNGFRKDDSIRLGRK